MILWWNFHRGFSLIFKTHQANSIPFVSVFVSTAVPSTFKSEEVHFLPKKFLFLNSDYNFFLILYITTRFSKSATTHYFKQDPRENLCKQNHVR